MGKLLNKTYVRTIDSIINKTIDNLHNPYYRFSDKPPTTVTYYNINVQESTLDEGTGTAYSYTSGSTSPLRYNKIKDFIIYGIDRIQVQIESGDFGAESDAIEGEAIILPNTIKPFPQDYFCINHIGKEYIFKITNVSLDTLPDGVNTYKINYRLSVSEETGIDHIVAKEFTMVANNLGTNLAVVIEDSDYDFCARLEKINDFLKSIYRALFYSDKTQTFVFTYNDKNFYDPYCLEFIIRHRLMDTPELPYLHIEQQLYCGTMFPIEYTKTMFYSVENKSKISDINNPAMEATLITDQTSLLSKFIEAYYVVHFHKMGARYPVPTFDDDIYTRIKDKEFYKSDSPEYFKNILIMYFNNMDFDQQILDTYEHLDFDRIPANELFYFIPVAIYIFERAATDTMKKIED